MPKKYDIIGLGECLVDVVATLSSDHSGVTMEGTAGGAPLNVLAAAAKLGHSTAFISKLGSDVFGRFLLHEIEKSGVEYRGCITKTELTTLAIVNLDETGDRDFTFYRNGTAEATLSVNDVDYDILCEGRIFHFGTVSMTNEIIFETNIRAAQRAKEDGVIVSFDPNYRAHIWGSEKDAAIAMDAGFKIADYIKVSEDEAQIVTGISDPEEAATALMERYKPEFLSVTLGSLGAIGVSADGRSRQPAFDLLTVDTTAAGDAFWGAALHKLLEYKDKGVVLDRAGIDELLFFANASGSLATTVKGAIPSLATESEILQLVKSS